MPLVSRVTAWESKSFNAVVVCQLEERHALKEHGTTMTKIRTKKVKTCKRSGKQKKSADGEHQNEEGGA